MKDKENSFDVCGEEKTKKIAKFSAFLYLGLAITGVIVATVGIFSISYDYEPDLTPISIPEVNFGEGDYSAPQFTITPEISDSPTDNAPVINDEAGVSPDISEAPVIEEERFYFPVESGVISKEFSMDALVFSQTMGDYRVHSGIDIAGELGSKVVCFADGIVQKVSEDYFYGKTVSVAHSDGSVSYYMNLGEELCEGISIGNEIKAGQQIGVIGNTARCESADPAHLHFELKIDGNLVNPEHEMPS